MILPFEERVIGQFYYCKSRHHEWIFQCIDSGYFPCIRKKLTGYETHIDMGTSFRSDWIEKRDEEIRLATPEEIAFIKSAKYADVKLIREPEIKYEIY